VLTFYDEYIINPSGSASPIRRRRVFYFGGPGGGGSGLGLILLVCLVVYFAGGFRSSRS
jgi:hypothetical protein